MNDEFGKENVFFLHRCLEACLETPLLGIAGNIFHVLSYQDKRTVEQVQAELRAKKKQKLQVNSF